MTNGSSHRSGITRLSVERAGGMDEVYCATDTKLDRAVAIKVLPQASAVGVQH